MSDEMPPIPNPGGDSAMGALIANWRRQRDVRVHAIAASSTSWGGIASTSTLYPPAVNQVPPDLLIRATLINFGGQAAEGQLVVGVSVAWFEILAQLERDPLFLTKVDWRKVEELVAGAYERDGWPEVVLTPRSNDGGRDIIATKPGVGSIRILDQIKAYSPTNLVSADEVRAMVGVLELEKNVSKGFVTTTSRFAPGIRKDPRLQALMPYRLELKDGEELSTWLLGIKKKHQP